MSAWLQVPSALLPTHCMHIFVRLPTFLEITWIAEIPCKGPHKHLSIALFQLALTLSNYFGKIGKILMYNLRTAMLWKDLRGNWVQPLRCPKIISRDWFSDIPPCAIVIWRKCFLSCKFGVCSSLISSQWTHCRWSQKFLSTSDRDLCLESTGWNWDKDVRTLL